MEASEPASSLARSLNDRVLSGVAGGLAAHWGWSSRWLRIGFVLASFLWGLGIAVYALLWIMLPEASPDSETPAPPLATNRPQQMVGILLVTLGVLLVWWKVLDWLSFRWVLAALLIGVGAFLFQNRTRSS